MRKRTTLALLGLVTALAIPGNSNYKEHPPVRTQKTTTHPHDQQTAAGSTTSIAYSRETRETPVLEERTTFPSETQIRNNYSRIFRTEEIPEQEKNLSQVQPLAIISNTIGNIRIVDCGILFFDHDTSDLTPLLDGCSIYTTDEDLTRSYQDPVRVGTDLYSLLITSYDPQGNETASERSLFMIANGNLTPLFQQVDLSWTP